MELNKKKGHMLPYYWLAGAGRTTSMVLSEELIISPLFGLVTLCEFYFGQCLFHTLCANSRDQCFGQCVQ